MIKIVITKVDTVEYKETENVLQHRVPTNIKRQTGYSDGREEIAYEDTYTPVEKTKTKEVTTTLLHQEIPNEDVMRFNLSAVIAAINKMKNVPL